MRRQRGEMQVNMAGLRRNIVNLAHNYSDAQVAQQCKENIFAIQTLKDFQYFEGNKDQGLNVREKAKQLVQLLKDDERLRNERARALKAKERFAQAASGFGSDGMEAISPPSPSFPTFQTQWSSCESDATSRELETARPQTVGEEELQLQLALAMSREEAEQEEQRRRSDDVRLQLALSQSEEEFKQKQPPQQAGADKQSHMLDLLDVNLGPSTVAMDPWGFPQQTTVPQSPPTRPQNDPWSSPASVPSASTVASPTPVVDPWAPVPPEPVLKTVPPSATVVDPWRAVSPQPPPPIATARQDPWSPSTNTDHSSPVSPGGDLDEFDIISNRERPSAANHHLISNANTLNNNGGTLSPDPFDLSVLGDTLTESKQSTAKKTPHSFLGENSALVNLDNLVTVSKPPSVMATPAPVPANPLVANPFAGVVPQPQQQNLFQQQQQPAVRPSINQIRQQPFGSPATADNAWGGAPTVRPVLPTPLLPSAQPNPFLS
ncbi:epsin-2 isoform X4 [Anabrus simplex]|uniref:epsin-2 isoform X4 n=1 Tax=Anabrus simplex TaxID=316456 RepID=UPI0034DD1D83